MAAIWNIDMAGGRFLDDEDNLGHVRVAVLGSEAKDKLFSGMDPLGQAVRFNGVSFQVVGVVAPRMQEGDSDINRQIYIPFNTMDVLQDNFYLGGIWLDYQGMDHEKMTRTIRESLAMAHNFKADDLRAVFVFDAQKQLAQFNIITVGLKVLLTFIGTITLGIGGIGLMNIMLVSVTQRTRDRRGEGAGCAQERHHVPIPGRGDGDHGGGRCARDSTVVSGVVFGRIFDALQCDGPACRRR